MLPPSSYSLTENEKMIVVQLILLLLCPIVAWHSTIPFQRVSRRLIGAIASTTTNYPGCSYDGEVVGSNGEIGSYILHSLNCKGIPEPELPFENDASQHRYHYRRFFATPRGLSPGCLSKEDSPIYACIPSSSIEDVWDATVPHRRKDLVFLCNCVPSRHLDFLEDEYELDDKVTVAVMHFGVSREQHEPKVKCNPQSPPSVIYGRHAKALAKLLKNGNVPVIIATSSRELQAAAVKKLVWSSLMWLLCHDVGNEIPMTVKDVHLLYCHKLQKLVEELLPLLELLVNEQRTTTEDNSVIWSVQDMMTYLETYSMSISGGNITPNRTLALKEINERNGLVMSLMNKSQNNNTSYHLELLRRVAGEELVAQLSARDDMPMSSNNGRRYKVEPIPCYASGMFFLAPKGASLANEVAAITPPTSVVVIGAGMIGSSIAYHLSRRGVNVALMDIKTNILPNSSNGDIDPGTATASSFAWLNANDKAPLTYQQLNILGMETWRRHDLLKKYPNWSGSLIRKEQRDETSNVKSPHYSCVGPLSTKVVAQLEPGVDFSTELMQPKYVEKEIYFYPQEGHVNPIEVVTALRSSARSNGVSFYQGVQIQELVRDKKGRIVGIKYTDSGSADKQFLAAQMVVVAAGSNTSMPLLGNVHIPLKYEPGVLAFCNNLNVNANERSLRRIFVDAISKSHILRRGKTLVIGGGELVVGGSETTMSTGAKPIDDAEGAGIELLKNAARSIRPFDLQSTTPSEAVRITQANRPMPVDGLPVIGFIDSAPGLYVTVTHSGITLGPLLGELAALEVHNSLVSGEQTHLLRILDDYRPSRFHN